MLATNKSNHYSQRCRTSCNIWLTWLHNCLIMEWYIGSLIRGNHCFIIEDAVSYNGPMKCMPMVILKHYQEFHQFLQFPTMQNICFRYIIQSPSRWTTREGGACLQRWSSKNHTPHPQMCSSLPFANVHLDGLTPHSESIAKNIPFEMLNLSHT